MLSQRSSADISGPALPNFAPGPAADAIESGTETKRSRSMRLLLAAIFCTVTLWGQGGGGVQFRDWTPPSSNRKAVNQCAELRSLTSYDLSVISAVVIPASATVPEHCRVSMMVPPE